MNTANTTLWKRPQHDINYETAPSLEVTEEEKFELKDGQEQWFLDVHRWAINKNYNPQFAPDGAPEYMKKTINEEIDENLLFYNGFQNNKILGYSQSSKVVHIPDQAIKTLMRHVSGNIQNMITPIEDQISAHGANNEIIRMKQEKNNEVELQFKMKDVLAQLEQQGVNMSPTFGKAPQTEQDVEEQKIKYRHEYEIAAETLARSLYYQENMKQRFVDATDHILLSNACSMHFTTKKTKYGDVVDVSIIPMKNRILDTRALDPYMTDQLVGGYISYMTSSEIFAKYTKLSKDVRLEIDTVTRNEQKWVADFKGYFKYPNVDAWKDDGTVSVARVYFLARRALKYSLMGEKYVSVDKIKNTDDVAGNVWEWDLHYCDVIGNKYIGECGYVEYVVRDDDGMPIIPLINLNYDTVEGIGRSLVGRLKYNGMQIDMNKDKLQELLAQNLGKNVLLYVDNEDKSALSIVRELRENHVTILNPKSPNDMSRAQQMMDVVDLTPDFERYMNLIKFYQQEQKAIINVTDMVLGAQTTVQGKGVQENTVQLASLSQLHLYTSIMSYFNNCLNYGFQLWKKCLKPGDLFLPISKESAKMLTVTKEFRDSDINVFVTGNDSINESARGMLMSVIQGYAQNIQHIMEAGLEPLDVLNLFYAIQTNSYVKVKTDIENKINKNKAMREARQMQEMEMQGQQSQQAIQQQMGMQMEVENLKQENANYRAEVQALSNNVQLLLKQFAENPAERQAMAQAQQQEQVTQPS